VILITGLTGFGYGVGKGSQSIGPGLG